MTVYRYRLNTLSGDYLRAVVGLVFCLGVLLSAPPSATVTVIFVVLAGIFAAFGARTALRHVTRIAVSDQGIASAAIWQRVLRWQDIDKVKLRYYGTRREQKRGTGWMQLTLSGGGQTLTLESTVTGFDEIADRTARAVRQYNVAIDSATAGNFHALGHLTGPPDGPGLRESRRMYGRHDRPA
jgi:hypothetical protein